MAVSLVRSIFNESIAIEAQHVFSYSNSSESVFGLVYSNRTVSRWQSCRFSSTTRIDLNSTKVVFMTPKEMGLERGIIFLRDTRPASQRYSEAWILEMNRHFCLCLVAVCTSFKVDP